jgi:hypothetical protein
MSYRIALIATGWSEPVPGRVYPRCGPPPFHGAPGYATNRPSGIGSSNRERLPGQVPDGGAFLH